jgi:hypothetical protein
MLKQVKTKDKKSEEFYLRSHAHLGDYVIILNCLSTRLRITKLPINLHGPSWVKQFLEIYDVPEITYFCTQNNIACNYKLKDILPRNNFKKRRYTYFDHTYMFYHDNLQKIYFETCEELKVKIEKRESSFDKVYFQYDSRNNYHYHAKEMHKKDLEDFIKKFKRKNLYGIGGYDTKKYLDRPFDIRELKTNAELLLGCKEFVGVDSGMSHLACSLKVKTTLINLHKSHVVAESINQMYRSLYPKTNLKIISIDEVPEISKHENLFLI